MLMTLTIRHWGSTWHALRSCVRGVSVIEFGLISPLLLGLGATGLEMVNFIIAKQKIDRVSSSVADLVARNTLPPNEGQINDMFVASRLIAAPFMLQQDGRVIVTAVIGVVDPAAPNPDNAIRNKIAWQRCSGLRTSETSNIGTQFNGSIVNGPTVALPNGVELEQGQMAIVAETRFRYRPFFNVTWTTSQNSTTLLSATSVFLTRSAVFPAITPLQGTVPSTC